MRHHQANVIRNVRCATVLAVLSTMAVCNCPRSFGQQLITPAPNGAFNPNAFPGPVPQIPGQIINQSFGGEFGAPSGLLLPQNSGGMIVESPSTNLIAPDGSHVPIVGLQPPVHQPTPSSVPNSVQSPAVASPQPSAFATVPQTPLQRYGYTTPVRASFYGGETYAEPDSFLSLEMLRPISNQLYQDGSEFLRYFDGRVGLNVGGGGVLANLGLGQRYFHSSSNTIVDMNAWYDVDTTRERVFQQIAGGGQIQNQNLLLRGHYYLPVGDTDKFIGMTALTGNSAFLGNNLALERFRIEDQAYHGYDVEAGLMLPSNNMMARWFVGYYNFETDNADPLVGYSTTINFDPIPNLTVGLQVTYDEETHDTGYLFSASYDFYHGQRDPAPNIRHRLGESVRRNHHIVSRQSHIYDPELATDIDGNLLNFIHVSSAGNSTGTFESPYNNLSQAAADALATPNSIIFAHADSIFDGQSIVLPANTRFLGETVDHSVVTPDTQLGTIVLPRATAGTARPIIRNSLAANPTITLANTTEVNGIRIENAAGTGIFASGMTGESSILNTSVDGASNGLHLFGNASTLTIQGLSINNTTATGIWVEDAAATSVITFADAVSVGNTGSHGIHFENNADSSSTTFSNTVAVTNSGDHGIFFDGNGDNATVTFDAAVAVATTAGNGVVVANADTSTVTTTNAISFADSLTISGTTQAGLVTTANDANVSIQTLAINNWTTSAISIDGNSGNLTVTDPITLDNANGSLASTLLVTNTSGAITFGDVTITDTARTATGQPTVFLQQNNTGVNDFTFNTLNVNASQGTALFGQDTGTNSKLVIGGGTINATNGTAISLDGLSTDVTLQSVSAANTNIGISLVNLGATSAFHEKFEIVGFGGIGGSGGTISNVQTGVSVNGSENVSLNRMNINSTVVGVLAAANGFNQPEDLTVNQLLLTDSGGTANWIGIDVDWNNGAHLSGANIFSSNTITGTATGQIGLRIDNNQSNPQLNATIGGNTINLTGTNTTGIALLANGTGAVTANNIGGINLTATLNNIVNATANNFISTPTNGAAITGNILVNGVLQP